MNDVSGVGAGESSTFGGDEQADVVFELDAGGTGEPGTEQLAGAQPAPVAQAQAAAPDAYTARIEAIERANAATMAELTPLVAHLHAQRRQQAEQAPFRPEDLDTNPNLKPSDILRYLEWQQRQSAQQIIGQSEYVARSTLSEQEARGRFNANELGAGNDYDSLVGRYVAPLVAQNPAVDQLLQAAAPGNPAMARMIFATVIAAIDRAGDDPVKGVKSILAGLGAYSQGARETRLSITRAAKAAAVPVLPGARANAGGQRQTLRSADDVWNLSDKAFDRMWNQPGL